MADRKLLQDRLKAISGGSRLDILAYLKKHRSASVSEIAKGVHRSVKTVSGHLSLLALHAIVKRRQRGQKAIYRLALSQEPPVKQILALL